MSLISKLFGGDKKAERTAKDILNGLFGEHNERPEQTPAPSQQGHAPAYEAPAYDDSPSGFSWGDNMPAEENQYNYPGPYLDYFEHIFREDFPGYSFERTASQNTRRRYVYTFTGAAGRALVVELMSENCSSKMTRRQCEAEGVPYLRFYYDHQGWWNTREYVVTRMRKVLG